ncbi:hypothetical protein BGZ95_002970 [Linnemannia exigua]|uniref:Mitochondrial proton/calcium exchanger protein n=1 Tax=Linnemannia exigua TaxID=604196 RepID=A0AAD4D4T1_9FUNG|nr:hypothetical protein BGZ95_002970 [Linnemannia exigua]
MNVTTPYYRSVKVQLVNTRHNGSHRSGTGLGYNNASAFHSSPFPRIPSSLRLLRAGEQQQQPLLKSTIEKETLASRSAEMAKAKAAKEASEAASGIAGEGAVVEPKKSLWVRFKNEMIHYWHGTKLLGKEIKISTKLAGRLLNGNKLTRREQRQLRRTTGDLMRLIPFSVFLIVPFMELLLPVALKLFPNMLPSTFEDKFAEEEKKRKLLKMRLEMAKFLQETIEESGIPGSQRAEAVKEFGDFFRKVRTTGEQASTDELIRLVSMARYMNLNAFGTDNFLRYQIRNKMASIKQDDKLIMAEGVDSLTTRELQAACQSRGIRTGGVSPARLRSELSQWLELNLTYAIPSSLLILSRAFSFSDSKDLATPVEALQATLSSLPDSLLTETELHVSELEGAATPQQKLEVLEQQEELIADEKAQEEKEEKARKERKEEARLKKEAEEKEKEKLKAQEQAATTAAAPVITSPAEVPLFDKSTPAAAAAGAPATLAGASELLTDAQVAAQVAKDAAGATSATKELIDAAESVEAAGTNVLKPTEEEEDKARMTEEQLLELREALCIMSSRSAVLEEREELEDLKEDRMEYKEDIEELAQVQRKEHNVSRRLGSRLEKMIAKLDQELQAYDAEGNKLHKFQANERGELTVKDIEEALKVIKHAPDADNIKQIVKKLDVDGDGLVLLSHIVDLADLVEEEEGTGVLVEGKKVHGKDAEPESEKKLKKEDVLKED